MANHDAHLGNLGAHRHKSFTVPRGQLAGKCRKQNERHRKHKPDQRSPVVSRRAMPSTMKITINLKALSLNAP